MGRTVHGMYGTKIYKIWIQILNRCNNPNAHNYKHYGGRGIKCLWADFQSFYDDMGGTYEEGLSIDRIDNEGHYRGENCAWRTVAEQNNNTRRTVKKTGQSLISLSVEHGIPYSTLLYRFKHGITGDLFLHKGDIRHI